MKYPTITQAQVAKIKASGRVVHIMPRKGLVRLDGYQVFRLIGDMPKAWEADPVDLAYEDQCAEACGPGL